MRVLVCGARDYDNYFILSAVLTGIHQVLGIDAIIEGGANGADTMANNWANEMEVSCETYSANWTQEGRAAGFIRNGKMLDEGKPGLVVAFKNNFDTQLRKGGTEHMVKIARNAGVPTYVVMQP